MAGHLRITSSVLPDATRVVAFRGREAISTPYELEVFMLVPHAEDAEIDLDDAVGGKAVLYVESAGRGAIPSRFAGIWAALELVNETPSHSTIRGVLVPRLWELGLSNHSRIFTNQSVIDVIKSVLAESGISGSDLEIRAPNPPAEEHITQYRESDLAFLSRWMEREGLYYFFEHGEHGEKLVIASGPNYPAEELGTPVVYVRDTGLSQNEGLRQFIARHALVAGQVRVRDYDYSRPQLEIAGRAPVAQQGSAEVNLHGERFFSPEDGARLAQVRADELRCRSVVYQGSGTRRHLRPGHAFALEQHPRASLNTKYLVVEAQHRGAQDLDDGDWLVDSFAIDANTSYAVDLVAIPASVQFRPERRTPWPRIYGYENATVEGPGASEYAQIDDQGRYRVKMRFDEGNQRGSRSSTLVRMMQPHGGSVEGFHFPLRKDTEVLVSFLGGDPDRPVISGVVPNALTPSPVTSGNHTRNVIQTGGHNRFELEDLAGEQRITLSTPTSNTYLLMGAPDGGHEAVLKTDDNALLFTGVSYDVEVGEDMTVTVGNNYQTTVKGGYYHVDVDTGPAMIHAKANRVDVHANTSFHVEAETAHGLIEAETYLSLAARSSYGKFKSKGKMTLESETADLHAIAKTDFKVRAKDGTGTVKSKGKLELRSTDGESHLHASTGIRIETEGNGIEMKAPADINIESTGAKVNLTSGGESTFSFFGDQTTIKKAAASTYTYGSKRDIRLGTDATYSLTAKTELSAGLTFSIKASLAFEVTAGMAFKYTALKAELETLKTSSTGVNNQNNGAQLGAFGSLLRAHGFTGSVGGVKIEA